jgi:hypothetical protein
MGVATANISNGVNGTVMSFGTLRNIDTRGNVASAIAVGDETWAEGDILYAHPTVDGKLTNVRPQHDLAVAFITVRHASSGQIAIRIVPGNFHLEWLHDVALTTPIADNELLAYDTTSATWINQTATEAGLVAEGDSRLTNSRTPTAHASTHASGGSDAITVAQSQVTNLSTSLAAKADLAGATFTGLVVGRGTTGAVVSANDTGSFSVRSAAGSNSASMSFHRPGAYAINMGLDTDNAFKVGGWSMGSIRFTVTAAGQVFGNFASTIRNISSGYTIVNDDAGQFVRSTGGAITVTLSNVLNIGDRIDFIQSGTGQITFSPSGITLNSKSNNRKTAAQHSGATVVCVASGVYSLIGDLVA